MTEERNNDISDPVVSDLYRESATERAPASLNETVLRDAAAHASKGYAHSMLWMRPLAYAAMVVLSLAIVVQVVLPPNMNGDVPASNMSPTADAGELELNANLVDAPATQTAEEDDPLKRLRDQEVREETKIEEFEVPAVASESVPEVEEPLGRFDGDAEDAIEEAVVQSAAEAPQDTDSLEAAALRSALVIREASDRAASQSVQAGDYAATALSIASPVESSICEPDETEAPDAWVACIERLEEADRNDEATRERILLAAAFPDFEWPAE